MQPELGTGAFIALVGPDGVGKTTVARQLIDQHDGPSLYIHFRPPVVSRPATTPLSTGLPIPAKRVEPGTGPAGWLRIARSWLVFWAGYLRWIRPAVRDGAMVVGDRWIYGYAAQPNALGFGGPPWLARALITTAPRPDLVVRLQAPASLIASRKTDLTASQAAAENERWADLSAVDLVVDATLEPSTIADIVLSHLEEREKDI